MAFNYGPVSPWMTYNPDAGFATNFAQAAPARGGLLGGLGGLAGTVFGGPIGGALGNLAGGLLQGGGGSSTRSQPMKGNIPYMLAGMDQARSLLNRGAYTGDYSVGMTPTLQQGFDALRGGYGSVADQYAELGQGMLPGLGASQGFYQDLLGGEGYLSRYDTPTGFDQGILESAVYNPVMDEQIAAMTGDVDAYLDDRLAQLKAGATGSVGGTGSSWRGLAEGEAMGDAARAIASASADMRNNALMQGYAASREANQMQQQANMQDWLGLTGAASNLFNIGGAGADLLGSGIGMQEGILNLGNLERGIAQQQLAGEMERFYAPYDVLNQYWSVVGGSPLGTETKTKGGGLF